MWSLSAGTTLTKRELNRQGTRALRSYNQDTTYYVDGASDSTSRTAHSIPNNEQNQGGILSLIIGANDASWRKIERRWVAYEARNVIWLWREKNCSRWCRCAISHSCQRKARKVGLELGQSTSLPLACLEMEMIIKAWDWTRWSTNVQLVANKHKMKKHYTVHMMTMWR